MDDNKKLNTLWLGFFVPSRVLPLKRFLSFLPLQSLLPCCKRCAKDQGEAIIRLLTTNYRLLARLWREAFLAAVSFSNLLIFKSSH
jgi:hypothetical protein